MNVLPYEVKRAHWRGTWFAIKRFRARADEIREPMLAHMTPARFDILYVVWRADWQVHERRARKGLLPLDRRINMSELRTLLGLAGPTISRTAHRLDELDFVRVIRDDADARCAVVVLTELGEKMLHLAVECIRQEGLGMRDRIVQEVSDGALRTLERVQAPRRQQLLEALGVVVDRWRHYARFFGCEAVPIYDSRAVLHLRPHTILPLTWHVSGEDPRSRIMNTNLELIETAARLAAVTG